MEKINIGMYVRTNNGIIGKIYKNIGDMFTYKDSNRDYITYGGLYNEITKASYNIIDILEVGDYVNGYKIGYIDDCKGAMREFYYDYENPNEDVGHWEEEIESVITYEQMEQMAYKVGE